LPRQKQSQPKSIFAGSYNYRPFKIKDPVISLGSSILFSEEFAKLIDAPVQDPGDVYMIGSRV